jgi:hypothetical protein
VLGLVLLWVFRVLQAPGGFWRLYYQTNPAYAGLLGRY